MEKNLGIFGLKYGFFLMLLVLVASCTSEPPHDGYIINGKALNFPSGTKVYVDEIQGQKINVLDTASISEDHTFTIKGNVSEKNIGRLRVGQGSVLMILDNKGFDIEIDKNDLKNFTVSGESETVDLDNLMKEIQAKRANPAFIKNYIDTTSNIFLGYMAINYLQIQNEFATFEKFSKRMQQEMPSQNITKEFLAYVNKNKNMSNIKMGAEAPEIGLASPDGENISLSSLRGKVVLVDFWASWCRPCRKENPHVVRLYNEYKDKGFDVYSVSLDAQKARWVKAIEQDGLVWPSHVSDLSRWNSAAASLYGVKSIPRTFLIDREGKIIGMNLRGQALEQKLSEIFS